MSGHRVLSVLEKAKMVCWFEETNSLAMVARRYRSEFGVEPPTLSQIKRIHRQFLETGSVVAEQPSVASSLRQNLFNNQRLNSAEAVQLSQASLNLAHRETFA
ncbi:unnamed protein product [Bursaphelenchus okinawaensis]|uniref:DUF4817 domain-containing protein n=1 Tax=Bursaphelenchus okinawaensis TaxID=465554 RepID=A0A811JUW5_9BILA|nr:unnamed protein product [Bursaphelenchus okinawaensis]CAG9083666.1 unnamed protein product [Bursaphelenchus okinawaensis]